MKKILILSLLLFAPLMAFSMSSPSAKIDAENFTLKDTSGKAVSLDSFKGHVVLVAFFTTDCPACQDEMPQLQALYEKYRSREFEVAGVNIRGRLNEVKNFAKGYKLTFPILLDEDGTVTMRYKVRYIPKLFLFDKNGKVIFSAQYTPMELLEKEIIKALK